MIEIREVIRRWQAQQSLRKTACEVGLDRKSVRRYFAALEALGATRDGELDDGLVQRVGALVQAREAHEPSVERLQLLEHRDRIEAWLSAPKPLRLSKVHGLLHRDHDVDVSYATLRRFAMDELAWGARKATVLVADAPPGEEAQVDFGLMGMMYDPQEGRSRRLYVLVVTCCFSRYQFVWPTWDQTTVAVCEALDEAWRFFGGVMPRIIPDNASSMVSHADALSPTIVDAFADYVQARGLLSTLHACALPRIRGA